jgi:hypothetical protein
MEKEEHCKKIGKCIEQLALAIHSLDAAKKIVKNARDHGVNQLVEVIPHPPKVVERARELITEVEKAYNVADGPLLIAKTQLDFLEKALKGNSKE